MIKDVLINDDRQVK